MKINYLVFGLLLTALISCKKEDDDTSSTSSSNIGKGVLVMNEGSFNAGNASLTFQNEKKEVSNSFYFDINKKGLGDVLQSVMETDNYYYFVLNNSGKVEVVGKNDLKSVATISGFRSPRYMLDLGNGKALVTNFVLDTATKQIEIDVVNLTQNAIEKSLPVDNWCEMMEMHGDFVYVANTGKNQVLVLDRNSLAVTKVLNTPPQPSIMRKDKNNKIWVLCKGDYMNKPAALVVIDPVNNTLSAPIDFGQGSIPERMELGNGGGNLYFLMDGVYKMSVGATSLSYQLIPNTLGNIYSYGLGIDPENGNIYLADAKDFNSSGLVKVFDKDGNLVETMNAGVAPNGFVFRK